MKEFTKVAFKSGQTLDIALPYVEFDAKYSQYLNDLRKGEYDVTTATYRADGIRFLFSEVESIGRAEQQEEKKEITKIEMGANIAQLEKQLGQFKKFHDDMGEKASLETLVEFMSKPDFSELAKETVELPTEEPKA